MGHRNEVHFISRRFATSVRSDFLSPQYTVNVIVSISVWYVLINLSKICERLHEVFIVMSASPSECD